MILLNQTCGQFFGCTLMLGLSISITIQLFLWLVRRKYNVQLNPPLLPLDLNAKDNMHMKCWFIMMLVNGLKRNYSEDFLYNSSLLLSMLYSECLIAICYFEKKGFHNVMTVTFSFLGSITTHLF